jgi:methionyl aminopeptidase
MIAKTQEERDALREGGKRLARHVRRMCEMIRPGITGHEIEMAVEEWVAADGDELAFIGYPSGRRGEKFPGGLCFSVNDIIVHAPAWMNDYVIQEGDVVTVDFGIKHKGLYTDHARTVIAGTPKSDEDIMLVRGTEEALRAGIARAVVGNTTGDIGHAVELIAEKYDFGFPRNLSGHGVGKQVHEEPHVPNYGEPGEGVELVENLVIAIEPMMTLGTSDLFIDKDGFSYRTKDGSRSAHAEDTVIITANGPEVITKE